MKAKMTSILSFIGLFYALPLWSQPELLFSVPIGVLALGFAVLFWTQPPLSIQESRKRKKEDKNSVWFILFGSSASQLATVVEWAYFRPEYHSFKLDSTTTVGLSAFIGGIIFRLWCIRTLGNYFTTNVQAQTNQRIVKKGAYRLIRHPSYLGAYVALIGSCLFLHASFSAAFTALLMLAVYWYRIRAEEKTLLAAFGAEYADYQTSTKKLFPFLW